MTEPINCDSCGGRGRKAYGCTSTWMGGAGGQMVTEGICDRCWGTGDKSQPGPNLRRVANQIRAQKEYGR